MVLHDGELFFYHMFRINLMVINVTNWSYMNNCIPLLTRDTKEKKKHTESNGL